MASLFFLSVAAALTLESSAAPAGPALPPAPMPPYFPAHSQDFPVFSGPPTAPFDDPPEDPLAAAGLSGLDGAPLFAAGASSAAGLSGLDRAPLFPAGFMPTADGFGPNSGPGPADPNNLDPFAFPPFPTEDAAGAIPTEGGLPFSSQDAMVMVGFGAGPQDPNTNAMFQFGNGPMGASLTPGGMFSGENEEEEGDDMENEEDEGDKEGEGSDLPVDFFSGGDVFATATMGPQETGPFAGLYPSMEFPGAETMPAWPTDGDLMGFGPTKTVKVTFTTTEVITVTVVPDAPQPTATRK